MKYQIFNQKQTVLLVAEPEGKREAVAITARTRHCECGADTIFVPLENWEGRVSAWRHKSGNLPSAGTETTYFVSGHELLIVP